MATRLWYRSAADVWEKALPIGTGRLAGMVLGGTEQERVGLNHEWLWRGVGRDRDAPKSAHLLPEVRELLLKGDYVQGTLRGNEAFGGPGGISDQPCRVDAYQPAGDLWFQMEHGPAEEYQRGLDLNTGLVTVTYQADGKQFRREYLAHLREHLLLVRITGDEPLTATFWLDRTEDEGCLLQRGSAGDMLAMDGQFVRGQGFRVEAHIYSEGAQTTIADNHLTVQGAQEILVAVNIGTGAKGQAPIAECRERKLEHARWEKLLAQHKRIYRKLYGGVKLSVPQTASKLPTDERLARLRDGHPDAGLPLLYFNYGRYLLVASAGIGELPPNLQGKWNEEIAPPWECDYHHDVNLQMNYWPAEAGALQFSVRALMDHIERFVPHARQAAQDLYDCDGVYFPLQTDPWGRATPEACGWAVWIGAAAWLAQHVWWHYEYGQDREFLRERAYPFLKEVAAFYESYLIEDDQGVLQVVPSQSPENMFVGGHDSIPVTLCVSATMDVQLAEEVLRHTAAAAEVLGVDEDKQTQWRTMRAKLPTLKVGRYGQLQEWNEDFEEAEPGHRHFSHLYALYPGDGITPENTPELYQAANVSLERRMAHEGGHTGWSRSWTACMYARLGNAERAWEHLTHLITDFSTDSLLDLHPPRIFQIDGNLGGTAAVLEMLLQSYNEELDFLPALPAAWAKGRVKGLRARGGYTVGMTWDEGELVAAELAALHDRTCTILHRGASYQITDAQGTVVTANDDGRRLRFPVRPWNTYIIRPNPTS